jgi:hypothetical protein
MAPTNELSSNSSRLDSIFIYRDQSNSSLVAEADHFTLFLAVQQVLVVLHSNELREAVLLRGVL